MFSYHRLKKKLIWSTTRHKSARREIQVEIKEEGQSRGEAIQVPKEQDARAPPSSHGPRAEMVSFKSKC